MSRRITEKRNREAEKLQKQIDSLVIERASLLDQASQAKNFKSKADAWRVVGNIELRIEKLQRRIRRLQTPHHLPNPQPELWNFAPEADAKPKAKKVGRP